MKINKMEYCWIWFWYNDITRLFIVLGLPSFLICVILGFLIGPGLYLKYCYGIFYLFFFAWMFIDNDYSHLRKIGLNEYRKKLKIKEN